jgi:hypothetical protein
MTATVLTDEQVESFVEYGYLTLHDCFTREAAQPWLDEVAPVARLLAARPEGILPDDFDYEDLISQCTSFVPDRVRRQERMAELEQGRPAEASS